MARSRFLISIISMKRSGNHVSSGNHEFDKLAINTRKMVTRFGWSKRFSLNVKVEQRRAEKVHRCVICNLIKPTIDNQVAWGRARAIPMDIPKEKIRALKYRQRLKGV